MEMDVAILLGILKRCVYNKATSRRATFNSEGLGFTVPPATGRAGLTREQLHKEMEQWMDMGEKIR